MAALDKRQLRNTLLLVLTALIWGGAFVAQSVGAQYVGAFTFLAARSWIGMAALLPVVGVLSLLRKKQGLPPAIPATRAGRRALLRGGFFCGLFLFLASIVQQFGMGSTTAAKAGFITTLYVIIVPIITLFMGRKVEKKIWLCVALGIVGLYLLCMTGSLTLSRGDALMILCAALFAGQILMVDHYSPIVDCVLLSLFQFFVVAALSTIGMVIFEHPTWSTVCAAGIPILYAGILSSGVAYTLQIVGQKDLNPTIASLAMCLESVFSALLGWLLLRQGLTGRELLGCLLMFAAIVLAQLPILQGPPSPPRQFGRED